MMRFPLRDPLVPANGNGPATRRALRLVAGFDLVVAVSEASRAKICSILPQHEGVTAPTRCVTVPWPVSFDAPSTRFRRAADR